MKRKIVVLITIMMVLQFCCGTVWAQITTANQAQKAVAGWLKPNARPLKAALGRQIAKVVPYTDTDGEPLYYIVYLKPRGFVIVSADDLVEPIIGFADDGTFDPSPENPLGALVTNDLNERIKAARKPKSPPAMPAQRAASNAKNRWGLFISRAQFEDLEGIAETTEGIATVDDIRVEPLIQTRWGQESECSNYCYNYHTPSHYPAGCVATAMAQLMKYHQHPTSGIGEIGFSIKIDGGSWETWYTRGGDGTGGQYNWADMVLDPNCTNYSDESWQAIGALCYDAGLSVNMSYAAAVSLTDTLRAKNALTTIFNYGNAIKGFNGFSDIGAGLTNMINPNLDAKDPVLIGITGPSGGHAVVCDGYGYTSSTLYHHLNMGWSGTYDAWYNLPTINSSPSFNSVYKCVYNIHVDGAGDGEIISGRVFDSHGHPIPNPIVYAEPDQGPPTLIAAESNNKGVYGIKLLDSNKQYSVYAVADGYIFTPQQITTGTSTDNASTSGNVSGVDFYGDVDESFYLGDFEPDGDIDWDDIEFFCSHWLETGCSDLAGDQTDWCYATDINHDQTVNYYDFAQFAPNWLFGTQ